MIDRVDLNCDLGEGYNDIAIMPYISSCNIACGGHYGDERTMREAIVRARTNGLSIGAHPSYPDKKNFGRVSLKLSSEELSASIIAQLNVFKKICSEEGVKLHHVKPHGALYNDITKDTELAKTVFSVIATSCPDTIIYGAANSELVDLGRSMNIQIWEEAFIDRRYENKKTLVNRQEAEALITNEKSVLLQLDQILNNSIEDTNSERHQITSRTICLHSDTKGATGIAKLVNEYLIKNGVEIS